MKVRLTAEQLEECKVLGAKRDPGRNDHNTGGDRKEDNYLGYVGEMAFEEWTGLPMRREGPDPGWDFEVGDITIDVKTTKYDHPHYLILNERKAPADIYLQCTFDGETVRFIGWVSKVAILMRGHWKLMEVKVGDVTTKRVNWVYRLSETYSVIRLKDWIDGLTSEP